MCAIIQLNILTSIPDGASKLFERNGLATEADLNISIEPIHTAINFDINFSAIGRDPIALEFVEA